MRLVLYATQTINGYIASETDETPWTSAAWKNYRKNAKQFKAIVIGRRTYQIMKRVNKFRKIGNPYVIVVSNFSPAESSNNLSYVKSPAEAMQLLKEMKFAKALVAGGGKLNGSFMKTKYIDEVWLDVDPVVFGTGIKLFYEDFFKAKLKLLGVKKLPPDTVQLRYKVVK